MTVKPTQFLPAETAAPDELAREMSLVRAAPHVTGVLDALEGFVAILNRRRQIVFLNRPFADFLRARGVSSGLGARMGDALDCVNVARGAVCGTTAACRLCGGAQALAGALSGRREVRELRLRTGAPGHDLNVQVGATPFELEGVPLIMLSISDLSDQQRRRVLERIFFHDITNTASGIRGWAEQMTLGEPEEAVRECAPRVQGGAERLLDEIAAQRDLTAAESGELRPRFTRVRARALLLQAAQLCERVPAGQGKSVVLADGPEAELESDPVLLGRVLTNLIKNALEAEPAGAQVVVSSHSENGKVVFRVRNRTAMPESVQRQVFQRSFSTKGPDRGLGTYGARLLTERYLSGTIRFESGGETGTLFEAAYPVAGPGDGRSVAKG